MRAVPTRDPGSVTPKSPAHQAGSVDTQTFLLEMIQTEIGVADLAAALKPRYVRDALKRRGVKIEADDDVGYNSLPLELRDNIRDCLIAVVQPQEEKGFISQSQKCQRCSRLAPYACINSEWRDAIEAVNFQRLKLGDYPASLKQDLELFERFVVDSRRKHLQYIRLRVDTLGLMIGADSRGDEPPEEDIVNAFTSPISRLLNCVQQWDEHITGDGNLHVHILTSNQDGWRTDPYPVSRTVLHAGLSKLPITPQITHLSTVLWDSFDSASLVALLSRMPNLRSLSIEVSTSELPEDTQERDSQTQRRLPVAGVSIRKLPLTWIRSFLQLSTSDSSMSRISRGQVQQLLGPGQLSGHILHRSIILLTDPPQVYFERNHSSRTAYNSFSILHSQLQP